MKYYVAINDKYLEIAVSRLEKEIDKLANSHIVKLRGDPSIAVHDGSVYIIQGVDLENK